MTAPKISPIEGVSTEKQVQAQIAEIGSNFGDYCATNFENFESMCKHLVSFKDFRVFLPIVCHQDFHPSYFSLLSIDNKESAMAIFLMNRIYENAIVIGGGSSHNVKSRTPQIGKVIMTGAGSFVNMYKSHTARFSTKFFLAEMPLRASSARFGRDAMEREKVTTAVQFNLLPIEKHFVEGVSPVIEYYMIYGKALPMLHIGNIRLGDQSSVRSLMRALEILDARTVAANIRSFEEIPTAKKERMRRRLVSIGPLVYQYLRGADKKYYSAFHNGFFSVKSKV